MADIQPSQQQGQTTSSENAQPARDKIHVIIRNRTQVLYDGNAKSVSSKNDTGVFDILPEHSNFISLISERIIIRMLDGNNQEITITNGLIKVKDYTVHCYVDLLSKNATITIPK